MLGLAVTPDSASAKTPPYARYQSHVSCAPGIAYSSPHTHNFGTGRSYSAHISAPVWPRTTAGPGQDVRSPDSPGSGLGLPIARDLAKAHGGTMTATSEVGHGTIVRFTLPLPTAPT